MDGKNSDLGGVFARLWNGPKVNSKQSHVGREMKSWCTQELFNQSQEPGLNKAVESKLCFSICFAVREVYGSRLQDWDGFLIVWEEVSF